PSRRWSSSHFKTCGTTFPASSGRGFEMMPTERIIRLPCEGAILLQASGGRPGKSWGPKKPRVEKELHVSLGSRQAAASHALDAEHRPSRALNLLDGPLVHLGIADDAALADLLSFELELRLHQDQNLCTGCGYGNYGRQQLGHRDE